MPVNNEDFIKRAFESGLNEDQVRAAVAERNQRLKTTTVKQENKPMFSPEDIGATIGDVLGGDIGPLSALFSGLGSLGASAMTRDVKQGKLPIGVGGPGVDLLGLLLDEEARDPALKEAGTQALISGATPLVLGTAAKVVKTPLKAIGEKIVKTGSTVMPSKMGISIDKGIDLYKELINRGYSLMGRAKSLNDISQNLTKQEGLITESIEKAGNPVVITKNELKQIYKEALDWAVDEGDEKAITNMYKKFIAKQGDNLTALQALDVKRKLYGVVTKSKSATNQARNKLAQEINQALKDKVEGVPQALREQEILLQLKPMIKRLRDIEKSKGINLNVLSTAKFITENVGPLNVSRVGTVLNKAGGYELPPKLQALSRFLTKTGVRVATPDQE